MRLNQQQTNPNSQNQQTQNALSKSRFDYNGAAGKEQEVDQFTKQFNEQMQSQQFGTKIRINPHNRPNQNEVELGEELEGSVDPKMLKAYVD
mmetsp:Transcript_6319/g.10727  ORF Transcript_6319/g.10727 Transcript_6319/m.10727 type:complete len:92 (+) Transcript_6319:455-730(+)